MRKASIFRYRLPLAKPLCLAGKRLDWREGLILRLAQQGREGFGEVAPLPGFSHEGLAEALPELAAMARVWQAGERIAAPTMPSVAFAWSTAHHELAQGPLHDRPGVQPGALISAPLAGLEAELMRLRRSYPGLRCCKVKVGRLPLREDIARLRLIMAYWPELRLRLDGNRSWRLADVIALQQALPMLKPDYLEEPLADASRLVELYQRTGWHYALDESVQVQHFRFKPAPGLCALVLKPTLVGSLERCYELIQQAHEAKVKVVLSSSYESSLGTTQLQALAGRWTPTEPPGLDTLSAFAEQLWRSPDFIQPNQVVSLTQLVQCPLL